MLTLDLTNAPRWHDLAPGVRVQLRPLTTAMMVATRSDPVVEAVPEEASDEERAVAFAKALARRAVLAREGIGDADGNPIEPGPEAIDALLDVWPIFEAFQLTYVSKGLLLEQEKNASALSPNGPSAGASSICEACALRGPRANVHGLPVAAGSGPPHSRAGRSGTLSAVSAAAPRATRCRDRLGHVGGARAG